MNPNEFQPWENDLAQRYRQLIELYEQAHVTVGELPDVFASGGQADEVLGQLHGVFERAAEIENEIRPIRDAWTSLQKRPSPALKRILQRAEQIVRSLLDRVGLAEDAAQQVRQSLVPQLAQESQRGRMINAYRSAQQH